MPDERLTSAPRTLWVLPKWPFPAQDGARVATVNLLKYYCSGGTRPTDLLVVAGEDESCDFDQARRELGVDRCFVMRRRGGGASGMAKLAEMGAGFVLKPWVPITMRQYASVRVRREIESVLSGDETGWDLIVYDGLHSAIHSSSAGRYKRHPAVPRVVYRAHNHETGIWKRKSERTRNPIARALIAFQAGRVGAFEHSLAALADGVATVSPDDLEHFRRNVPAVRGTVVPIGYDFTEPPEVPPGSSLQLMFLGKLDWMPNRDGLIWFLKEVWPEVVRARSDLKLAVAGSGDPGPIRPYLSQDRVEFFGRVESVESLYRESALSLVPVFYGSGTRVKVIEAARFGRGCLSTALGVEGVGLVEGESYLRAESAEEWIRSLKSIDRNTAVRAGRNAFDGLRARFDAAAVARAFADWLDQDIKR